MHSLRIEIPNVSECWPSLRNGIQIISEFMISLRIGIPINSEFMLALIIGIPSISKSDIHCDMFPNLYEFRNSLRMEFELLLKSNYNNKRKCRSYNAGFHPRRKIIQTDRSAIEFMSIAKTNCLVHRSRNPEIIEQR
jgi:hypothetical protein